MNKKNFHAIVFLFLFSAGLCFAQDEGNEDYSWKETASRFITDADMKQFEENGFLIRPVAYRQVFTPYIENEASLPFFITSDSLIKTFSVLLEESVIHIELKNAVALKAALPEMLEEILKLPENSEITGYKQARRRALGIITVSAKLLNCSIPDAVSNIPDMMKEVELEIKRINEASETAVSPFTDARIDYSHCRVRGFYDKNKSLSVYFKAISYWSGMAFYIDDDNLFLTALILGWTVNSDSAARSEMWQMDSSLEFLLGYTDGVSLMDLESAVENLVSDISENKDFIESKRKELMKDCREEINDQWRLPVDGEEPGKVRPSVRLAGARWTVDAALFSRTTRINTASARQLPSGLEVAGLLGSDAALGFLDKDYSEKALVELNKMRGLIDDGRITKFNEPITGNYYRNTAGRNSLYAQYLYALSALLKPAEKEAPLYMNNPPWKKKQINAVLAGWAQLKHVWVLQSKMSELYICAFEPPPGFVEPVPEFYERMGNVCDSIINMTEKNRIWYLNRKELGSLMQESLPLLKRLKDKYSKGEDFNEADESEMMNKLDWIPSNNEFSDWFWKIDNRYGALLDFTARVAPLLIENKLLNTEDEKLVKVITETGSDLCDYWAKLKLLCVKLEIMAHKQLRGREFSNEEEEIIRRYGEIIGELHFYGGNSWASPRDDSVRIVDVAQNSNNGVVLEAGVGRALEMLVLYPWEGRMVLCVGAIMPYYEFSFPQERRLTDNGFKILLDSKNPPAFPGWMRDLYPKEKPILKAGD